MSDVRCEICGNLGPCFDHIMCKVCGTHRNICGTCMYTGIGRDWLVNKSIRCVRCARDKQIDIILYNDEGI